MRLERPILVAVMFAFACAARADKASANDASPKDRATATIKAQLAAIPDGDAAFAATFSSDAVVLIPDGAAKVQSEATRVIDTISSMHPHAVLKGKTFDNVVAGGNGSVVWFSADLTFTVLSGTEDGSPANTASTHLHAVELMDASLGWKVVVAAFSHVDEMHYLKATLGEIPSATSIGPLANLLAAPDTMAASLADNAVVLGTDPSEHASGKGAAQALLAKWKKLPLSLEAADKVREVHATTYGYALANVNLANSKPNKPPYRMNAIVVALPGPSGTWAVVAASYGS